MQRSLTEKEEMYVSLLKRELIPALGCTEPIAIAFASAYARDILGHFPEKIEVQVCGNIIKNTKSVVVPNTNGLKGIETAVVIGALGGKAEKQMEVLCDILPEQIEQCKNLLNEKSFCKVNILHTKAKLHLRLFAFYQKESAFVELIHMHTNIVRVEKNGTVIESKPYSEVDEMDTIMNEGDMSLRDIYDFIQKVPIERIAPILKRQIKYNLCIAQEGLAHDYGLNVGKTLIKSFGETPNVQACAYAAAGSDARMSGCTLPVVINSGSGNQGLAASLPVIIFAKQLKSSEEELIRALSLSNLVVLYQKASIGRLSAYCGAVSAACGSGAAIAYLHGDSFECMGQTIKNTLANIAGMVCDGAKPSCAAKIFSAVEAAILGYELAASGKYVQGGDGLISNDIDRTIDTYGKLAHDGMLETDKTILNFMISY